ncbi:RBBP9/YdeN family alpha/beta hydrolase [Leuconostoc inhae]|uniref:RBBP9/YdeN family alpha/beta hydrolase n=1 Tax=Leuconostoc inhae TaxID=178001 RepID=UPI001C7D4304|nr:alpha/beta hydrolase [Leuconostoc inhae]
MKHMLKSNDIYLIHGYTASPTDNWFPWLKNLVSNELSVPMNIINMPHSDDPKVEEWDKTCDNVITCSNNMTIIGHSLGCIEALRFVSQHNVSHVNLILVSGFDETTTTLPQLHEFTDYQLEISDILPKINHSVVISAIDDDIIPYHYSQSLAQHLKCPFILLPNGKHFIDRDNIYELPRVYQELTNMLTTD